MRGVTIQLALIWVVLLGLPHLEGFTGADALVSLQTVGAKEERPVTRGRIEPILVAFPLDWNNAWVGWGMLPLCPNGHPMSSPSAFGCMVRGCPYWEGCDS